MKFLTMALAAGIALTALTPDAYATDTIAPCLTQVGLINLSVCGQCGPCTDITARKVGGEALTRSLGNSDAIEGLRGSISATRKGLREMQELAGKLGERDDELEKSIDALDARVKKLEEELNSGCVAYLKGEKGDKSVALFCLEIVGERHAVDRSGLDMVGGARISKRKTKIVDGVKMVDEDFVDVLPTIMTGSGVSGTGCRRFSSLRGADSINAGSIVEAEVGCDAVSSQAILDANRFAEKGSKKGLSKGARVAIYIASVVAAGAAGGGIAHLAHPGNDRDVVRDGVHESHTGKSAAPYGAAIGVGVGALALLPLILGGDD